MTTQAGSVVGCIVYDSEEFKTWVSNNLATYLARGLRFNKSVYKQIRLILRDFDTVAAIIPDYEEDNMEYPNTRIFQLYEELGHDTIRCRIIFEGINVITTESGNADRCGKNNQKFVICINNP